MSLIPYAEALANLLGHVEPLAVQSVPLEKAAGYVLAEDVRADRNVPPFTKALMDGYALRSEDLGDGPTMLHVVGTAGAGKATPKLRLEPGQAIKIMTGAPLPEGADTVQMVERTRCVDDNVTILERVSAKTHVAAEASEVKAGQVVLKRGRLLRPAEVGVLATFGKDPVAVGRRPEAAVIPTGDELIPVQARPEFGQIRNSNALMLQAQFRQLGVDAEIFPIVPDRLPETRAAIERALEFDVSVFCGGVSMGDFDYVPRAAEEAGVEIAFHKVAVKPGKPVLFGKRQSRLLFGLPGNPVSSLVTFELFVRPAVRKMMGFADWGLSKVSACLQQAVQHRTGRDFYMPAEAVFEDGRYGVRPIQTMGSSDLTGFSKANALLIVPASKPELAAGAETEVILLPER